MNGSKLFDLSGRVALITGASRGIGASIARLLAAHGAHVVVTSRKLSGCEAVAASIREAGGSADALACHIGDLDAIAMTIARVGEAHGKLDVLVNNAAVNPFFGNVLETEPRAFDKTVEVNLRGTFYMSVEAGKLMKETGGGSIVNVASINGVVPGLFQAVYSITKAAVISMTHAFAKECAQYNIRVNALLPGLTDTKFAAALVQNEAIVSKVLEHVPLRRVAQPDEMAGAVLYLVSDSASYTTGTCLTVDGGYLTA